VGASSCPPDKKKKRGCPSLGNFITNSYEKSIRGGGIGSTEGKKLFEKKVARVRNNTGIQRESPSLFLQTGYQSILGRGGGKRVHGRKSYGRGVEEEQGKKKTIMRMAVLL